MHYVYIIKCRDGTFYTGLTGNLKRRLVEHSHGLCFYSRGRLPFQLVYYASFLNKALAASFEQYLKKPSGIAFRNKRLIVKS